MKIMDNQNKSFQESESQNSDSRHPELGLGSEIKNKEQKEMKKSNKGNRSHKNLLILITMLLILIIPVTAISTSYLLDKYTVKLRGSDTVTSTSTNKPASTNNETANWETYHGFGYSIKYPPEIKVTSNNNEDTFSFDFGSMKITKSKTSSKDIFEEFNRQIMNSGFCKIGKYDAFCVNGDPVGSIYYFINNNTQYAIMTSSGNFGQIERQMLSTIEFLE